MSKEEKEQQYFREIIKAEEEFVKQANKFFGDVKSGDIKPLKTKWGIVYVFYDDISISYQLEEKYKKFLKRYGESYKENTSRIINDFLFDIDIECYYWDTFFDNIFDWLKGNSPAEYNKLVKVIGKNAIVLGG